MELMRQRRSTVARRIADIPALGRLFEDSEQGGLRNVGAAKVGAGTAPDETICNVFCLTHERPAGEKSCAAFLRRYWMWRAPPDKGRSGSVYPQPGRLEGKGCFSTRVDACELFVRDCGLDTQNFTLRPGAATVLDWPTAPKTARAGPHRARGPPGTERQDAPDTTKLCGALRLNEKLTNPRTAQVERAVAPQNATAHSAKRGALRRAAPIVGAPALDRARPRSWRDTVALSAFPRTQFDIWEAHHNADQVSSLADRAKGEPRKDGNPG
ncbi:hypothetical protein TcBrA4_0009810 [Trypanosoma cruzi]|nr:hypothetical protein TcBrA4_0009810 [Trypanosoma cruzi]